MTISIWIGLVVAFLLSVPMSTHAKDWNFIVAPYVLVPSIEGSASARRIEDAGVNVDPVDIIKTLNLGGMLHLEARHVSNFGIALDYSFMDLSDGASLAGGAGSADVDIFQGVFQAYGTYRIKSEPQSVDVYAGIRWWDIDVDLGVSGGPINANIHISDSWVDPVIGMRGTIPLGEGDWKLMWQGDVGGLGVGADFTWNAQGGALWEASDNFSLVLQYRALGVDRKTGTAGTSDRFAYDTITHGPIIGFAFKM
ncbi:MAG: hypothetical protein KUG61_02285 [Parvibaculaceae bacterium]|nr:hypothetical protein [Parvibaculaceae bacterium]